MHTVGHLFFVLSSYEVPGQQRDAVERNSIFQQLLFDIGKGKKKCGSRKMDSKIKSSKALQKKQPTTGIVLAIPGDADISRVVDIHFGNPDPSSNWACEIKFSL